MSILLNRILIFLFFLFPITILTSNAGGNFILASSIIVLLLYLLLKKNNIFLNKDNINYFTNHYSLFAFSFSVYVVLSLVINKNFNNSFLYIRFWLYTLIIIILIDNKNTLKYFSIFFFFIFNFFVADGFIQLITGYNVILNPAIDKYNLINGFFNDKKLGSALSRLFPIYLYLISQNQVLSQKKKIVFISCLATLVLLIFTRERVAMLLGLITFTIYYLINFNKRNLYVIFFGLFFFILTISLNVQMRNSLWVGTTNQIFSNNKIFFWSEVHQGYAETSFIIYKNNMIFGSGAKSYREECKLINVSFCNTHPHNFFFQILSELGTIGIFFYLFFYIFLIKKLINSFASNNKYSILLISALLFNFNPLFPSGSFFNSWLNCLLYFPLAFLIGKNELIKKK
jgi:O-antigen ligase